MNLMFWRVYTTFFSGNAKMWMFMAMGGFTT
jgi:hypothetical protein